VGAADPPPVAGHPWPVFELRIRTDRLELRLPTDDELVELCNLARAGIHPPEEMPFSIAWTDRQSPEFERSFMQYHWHNRADWQPARWVLELGVWADGRLVGSQGLFAENFAVLRNVGTGSWLGRAYQGQGIGRAMRGAVLALAFDHLRAEWASSTAFVDNHASAAVSRALGYMENGRDRGAPRGEARELVRYRMTLDQWRSRNRPPVEVSGLEAALDLFGIDRATDQ
jgi:RimJ/RimL family protein N-acetyltransferase